MSVSLLFDERADHAMRALWDRLEDLDVPTLRSHTHGRHVPHISYVVLRDWNLEAVRDAVEALPEGGELDLQFDALGVFRRGRTWLVPAVTTNLLQRQSEVAAAVQATGAEMHMHYQPGVWVPHCALAPRVQLTALPVVAAAVYDVLPLSARISGAALIDSGRGTTYPLVAIP